MPRQTNIPKVSGRPMVGRGNPDDLDKVAAQRGRSSTPDRQDSSLARALVEYFTELRRKRRWSQAELARRIDTTQSSVSEFETGQSEPRLSTLERYAEATGFELEVRILKGSSVVFSARS